MDNVEKFDSGIEAMHKVKKLIAEIDQEYEKVYLAFNEYHERWYVSDDVFELSDAIHQRWCDSGCDSSPENESEEWQVWEYMMAIKKEKYPNSYDKAKRSLIKSHIPMIRMKRSVGCEYSVAFTIN